eukprot:scaffold380_cov272-Pinguiococcus_pyrenoidosus.AAC.14
MIYFFVVASPLSSRVVQELRLAPDREEAEAAVCVLAAWSASRVCLAICASKSLDKSVYAPISSSRMRW